VPLPHGRFVAAGGVNQGRATDFILAGAVAIGQELIPKKAVQLRSWIGFKNWRAVSWSL
jgi:2-keto-3-deoxy-6-phosphogluconate aldolase